MSMNGIGTIAKAALGALGPELTPLMEKLPDQFRAILREELAVIVRAELREIIKEELAALRGSTPPKG